MSSPSSTLLRRYRSKWYIGPSVPAYSLIMEKEGELVMSFVTPRWWQSARMNVVLPAPISPLNATTVAPEAFSASANCFAAMGRWEREGISIILFIINKLLIFDSMKI